MHPWWQMSNYPLTLCLTSQPHSSKILPLSLTNRSLSISTTYLGHLLTRAASCNGVMSSKEDQLSVVEIREYQIQVVWNSFRANKRRWFFTPNIYTGCGATSCRIFQLLNLLHWLREDESISWKRTLLRTTKYAWVRFGFRSSWVSAG